MASKQKIGVGRAISRTAAISSLSPWVWVVGLGFGLFLFVRK